jgi:L-ascorbate 6-phosphate lactonase
MTDASYGAPHLIEAFSSERVPTGAVALWWLGQASFTFKSSGGAIVYVDPYLAVSDRRITPAAFAPDAVTNGDLVILTHDHGDHVDPRALPGIAKASPRARIAAPQPIVGRVAELVAGHERVIPAVSDETLRLEVRGETIELVPVPAAHETLELTPEGYTHLGFTVRLGGVNIHHTGDTVPFEGQVERVKPHDVDVLLVPINGRDFYRTRANTIGNMDYREAGDFSVMIGAKVAIPIHYGMFRGNTVPPGYFITYLADYHPEQSAHVMGRFGKYLHLKG